MSYGASTDLNYAELETMFSDVANLVNQRPLADFTNMFLSLQAFIKAKKSLQLSPYVGKVKLMNCYISYH